MRDKSSVIRDAVLLGLIHVLSALVVVCYWRSEKQEQEITALKGQVGTLHNQLQTTKDVLQSTRDEAASIAYVREMGQRANSIIGGLDSRLGKNETLAKTAGPGGCRRETVKGTGESGQEIGRPVVRPTHALPLNGERSIRYLGHAE